MKSQVIDYLRNLKDLTGSNLYPTARAFGMSNATLQRGLTAEGTSFGRLLNDERKQRCDRLKVINPNLTSELVGKCCGFRGKTSGERSFKGWYNMGLREFKAL